MLKKKANFGANFKHRKYKQDDGQSIFCRPFSFKETNNKTKIKKQNGHPGRKFFFYSKVKTNVCICPYGLQALNLKFRPELTMNTKILLCALLHRERETLSFKTDDFPLARKSFDIG